MPGTAAGTDAVTRALPSLSHAWQLARRLTGHHTPTDRWALKIIIETIISITTLLKPSNGFVTPFLPKALRSMLLYVNAIYLLFFKPTFFKLSSYRLYTIGTTHGFEQNCWCNSYATCLNRWLLNIVTCDRVNTNTLSFALFNFTIIWRLFASLQTVSNILSDD